MIYMKVSEVIKELNKYNQDEEVYIWNEDYLEKTKDVRKSSENKLTIQ